MTAARYVALVGGAAIERLAARVARSGGFAEAYRAERLVVLTPRNARPIALDRDGVVLGTLFTRGDAPRRVTAITTAQSAAIQASAGDRLISGFWGNYVAILRGRTRGDWSVLRDPSGALACYHAELPGALIFASDVAAIAQTGAWAPRIDWVSVAHHLRDPGLRGARTGLAGLLELAAGGALVCEGGRWTPQPRWSPWDHVAPSGRGDGDAADALLATIGGSVRAWGSCFDAVLVGVSGGLDSSIVAACLAGHAGLSLHTLAARDPDGDERRFARLLAAKLRVPLDEAFYEIGHVDVARSNAAHLPRPVGLPWLQASERAALATAARRGADAVFDGNGGDNVFCHLHSVAPLVDRLRTQGPGRGAWRTLRDLCRMHRASAPTVLRRTLRKLLAGSKDGDERADARFLGAGAEDLEAAPHPWLAAPPHSLPGKRSHVAMVLAVHDFLGGFAHQAGTVAVSPLMAQPIVELCLSIPTWQWCAGGVDRALARRAFAGLLPPEIVRRTAKGGPDAFLIELLEAKRSELRALLLDGLLARHGIVDRPAIERALDDEGPQRGSDYIRLLAIADAEVWVRGWASAQGTTVA